MKNSSKEKNEIILKEKENILMKNIHLVLRCIALAIGIGVIVLGRLDQIDLNSSMALIAISLTALTISIFEDQKTLV